MAFASLQNHRGFFSDYWLGTVLSARGAAGARLTSAQAKKALERVTRLVESINGVAEPELTRFRERFARPLLEDLLGFEIRENAAEPRLRPLAVSSGNGGVPVAVALLCPDHAEFDAPRSRRQLENGLVEASLDYGFIVSPEVLRLVRRPGLGARSAAFDLSLASAAELQDLESLAAAFRVLSAQNFVPGTDGARPIDLLEQESRRHSARVSNDLKQAVFEAAERIVGGFLADIRSRPEAISPLPSIAALRDAGFLALYRLLFILYAEARDERLINHRLYQKSYSLDHIVARLLRAPLESRAANRHGLWSHLQAVFRIFNEGIAPNLPDLENIPPRGGHLFSEETPEGRLLRALRLDDRQTAAILLSLATSRPRRGVGRERVSFRELEIEQLGAVYEGLLEYEPEEAPEALIEVNVGGREFAVPPEDVVRLCELKNLSVRGDASIVAGTAAGRLHADHVSDEELEPGDAPEDAAQVEEEDTDTEEDSGEPSLARGSSLQLLRRIERGEFYFKPGSARKSSGSYYTPTGMVNYLAREALGPLVEGRGPSEIQRLRVIDLACGSGHFLVGAARFLAGKLHEAYRHERGNDPPPEFHSDRAPTSEVKARWEEEGADWCKRRIVEKCLFGVDLNRAAVQLAQVALWIESLAGDRPLTFFAHHIRCGNSLLGSWLSRLDGPPDPRLSARRDRHTRGLFEAELKKRIDEALAERRLIDAPLPPEVRGDTPEEYAYKEDRLRRAEAALTQARLLLNLRSAAPFVPAIWRELPQLLSSFDLEADARSRPWWPEFEVVRDRERFFHWELEFPEVLLDPERPGFDAVLGNPPWDKVLPSKHEFYGRVDVLIRAFKGNELDRRIRELHALHPGLDEEFDAYRERATTVARMLRGGGDFPLAEARSQAAHEDVAKYFVDRAIALIAKDGAIGLVVPSVLYNGDGCVGIRRYLVEDAWIERFYGFENRKKIFPIHSSYKFVNLVARKTAGSVGTFTAAFMRHDLAELDQPGAKPWEVRVTRGEIATLSPETYAFLEYRSPRDQEIVHKMYRGRATLGGTGNGSWGTRKRMTWRDHERIFNSAEDKDLFTHPETGLLYTPIQVLGLVPENPGEIIALMECNGFWPVYQGKQIDQFLIGVKPIQWWLSLKQLRAKYKRIPTTERTLVLRDIASNTNERTAIAAVLPPQSVGSDTLNAFVFSSVDPDAAATVMNSFCFDFVLRLRTAGTHVSFTYLTPMPVPPAAVTNSLPRLDTRPAWETGMTNISDVREAWESLWVANKAVAEAYGLNADDFAHILNAFPGFARKRPEFHAFLVVKLAEWGDAST